MHFLDTWLLVWGWLEATGRLRVGAVWVGRWESSEPRLPDRRAFVPGWVGWVNAKCRSEVVDGRKSGGVEVRYWYSIS